MQAVKDQQSELDDDPGEESTLGDTIPVPTLAQAYQALDWIRRFTLSMSESEETESVMQLATNFEQQLLRETPKRTKQTAITDFKSK